MSETPNKPVRVWADGCFDMMHYGHANALRQAKALGDYLIVGVHSDEEILQHKGPTVMKEEERYAAVAACKWVDEVVKGAPYTTSLKVLEEYNVDFCVHGDDIVTTADGVDTYHEVKAAHKFRVVPRTIGVSSTDLVGRMLLLTKSHFTLPNPDGSPHVPHETVRKMSEGSLPQRSPYTGISHFFATSRKIVQFSERREPKPTDIVVYIDGTFDMFHVGHAQILQKAKELGNYLIVGLYDDQTVNQSKGGNYPIMNLQERVLGVLSCRYVDEVVIGANKVVSKEFIETFRINLVIVGMINHTKEDEEKYYKDPIEMKIFRQIPSPSSLTTYEIVQRIIANRLNYEERNRKKQAKELQEIAAAAGNT